MYGKPGTWLGKHFSNEHKENLSLALKGKKRPTTTRELNPSARKVINLNTGEIFGCIKDASEKYSVRTSSISRNINGQTQTCCGCKRAYYEESKEYVQLEQNYRNPKKKVYILELDKICDTATAAAKLIGCDNSLVSKQCKKVAEGEYALVKNYHIKYIE